MEENKEQNIKENNEEAKSVEPIVESLDDTGTISSQPIQKEPIDFNETSSEVVSEQPTQDASSKPVVAEPVVIESNEEPVEQAISTEAATPVDTPTETTNETTNETTTEATSEPVKEETSKKKKSPILIILILVIIIAIAVAAIVLLQPKDKKNNNGEADNKNTENTNTIETNGDIKSEYRLLGNALQKFDLAFLKLENKEENKVYSPLSIKYALEMLSEGTSGDTKKQLDAVIGDYQNKKYVNNDNMSFANAMFIRDTFADEVKDEYKSILQEKYGAEVINDTFENPNNINKWISDKTFGLIPDLIKDSNKDFYLINALAIDMKWNNQLHCATGSINNVPCVDDGSYYVTYEHEKLEGEDEEYSRVSYAYSSERDFPALKFNGKDNIKSATVLASFNRYDAVKTIGEDKIREEVGKAYQEWLNAKDPKQGYYSGMEVEKDVNKYLDGYITELGKNYGKSKNSTDFSLYVDDNVKVFSKDLQTYNGTTLQYVGIMPRTTKLTEYVSNVTAEDINSLISNLKELKIENFKEGYATIIEGQIPFFKYEFELNLIEDFKKLGIEDVFNTSKADFSSMLKNATKGSETIVEAKHKANIEFSNEGIKAAAVTTDGGAGNVGGGFNYLYEVPTERIDITFDNPYLYLIRDKNSGEVWFVGTVYEPVTK